jgi:hypothetical protein
MAAEHAALYRELAARGRRRTPDAAELARAEQEFQSFGNRSRPGASTIRKTWRSVRHSRFYRELPLRRLLPESIRGAVERRASELLDRLSNRLKR